MHRRDVQDAAPAAGLHARQRAANGVEGRRQVERDDGVPAVDRELLDRGDMLDAGVVDQHVDADAGLGQAGEHRVDVGGA